MDDRIRSIFVDTDNNHIWQTDSYDFIVSEKVLLKLFGKTYKISSALFDPTERTVVYTLYEIPL